MSKYRLSIQLIVGVLWLILGAGCRKDPPEPVCGKGCCSDIGSVRFAAHLNGVLISQFGTMSISLAESVNDKEPFQGKTKAFSFVLICPKDEALYEQFLAQRKSESNSQNIKYKIWAEAYEDLSVSLQIPDRIYTVKINRFEKAP